MDTITLFEKARELGEAIAQSSVYKNMRQTETMMKESALAQRIMADYNQAEADMRMLMASEPIDRDAIHATAYEIEQLENEMSACDVIQAYKEAQRAYAQVLDQINAILRHHVGVAEAEHHHAHGGGCHSGGGCSSCSGCH